MEYETLTPLDKLNIVKDALRGKESDHFRLSLLPAEQTGGYEGNQKREEEVKALQRLVKVYEEDLPEAPEPPPYPDPAPEPLEDEQHPAIAPPNSLEQDEEPVKAEPLGD